MLRVVEQELMYGADDLPLRGGSAGSSGRSSGSESPIESDYGEKGEGVIRDPKAYELAAGFKYHLKGLYEIMHELTNAAKLVSNQYQDDVTACRDA